MSSSRRLRVLLLSSLVSAVLAPPDVARAAPPTCAEATLRFSPNFQWLQGAASYADPDGDPESGSTFGWIVNGQPAAQGQVGEMLFLSFDGDAAGAGGETPETQDGLSLVPGQWGQALALDSGGHLAYSRQGNLDLAEGTVSLWVALREDGSTATYSNRRHVLLHYRETDGDTWAIAQSDGGTLYAGGTVGGQWQSAYDSNHASMTHWSAGAWHHLAFTFSASGGFMRFYVDGVLAGDTNEGRYDVPGGGSDAIYVGGDAWGNEAAYWIDALQILDHAVSEEEVRALAVVGPAPFAVRLPTASLQVGDTVSFSFTPSDGLETGLPCESDPISYPGIPVTNPQPPSTLLPPGTTSLTLSVDTVTPTEARFSVGQALPFDQMTPFDQGAGTGHHGTTVPGIDPDPNVVTPVYVRCGAYPDFLLVLRYRALSETDPSYPRTGNLWGSSDYCPDDIAGCARVDLWLGAHFSPAEIRTLRELNPSIRVLTSINTIENRDLPDDYYLQDIHGQRIETWPGSYRLNVTKPYVAEYQARYAAQKILDSDLMYDGCFFDNFMTTQSYWDHDIYGNPFEWDYNEDGVTDDPGDLDAAWRLGVLHEMDVFLELMPNALVCGHSMRIHEDGIADRFHGISIGFMTADVLEGDRSFDALWDRYHAWNTLARSPHLTMIESSPPDQIAYGYDYSPWDKIPESTLEFARTYYPSVRFGLTFTLMDDGFFAHEFGDTWHGNRWWYDELDFDLGPPEGPAEEIPLDSVQPVEMIRNGGFEEALESTWHFWVDTSSGCAGTLDRDTTEAQAGAASAHVDLPQACDQSWHAELAQDLPPLTADQPYRLRFWARSDRARTLEIITQQNQDPWENYGLSSTVSLTPEWAEYDVPFVATQTTDQASLEFLLAGAAGPVWLDEVRLTKRPPYVLRRNFARGVVLLNPLRHAQVVPLEDGLRRLQGTQAPRVEYLLDDADGAVSFSGAWQELTLDSGEWKASGPFFHDWGPGCHLTSETGAEARYALSVPEADTYHVAAWWPAAPEASTWSPHVAAEVLVDGEVVAATTLNQHTGGDEWHELAAVDLDPERDNVVRLRCGADGPCVADALHIWSRARYNDGQPVSEVRLEPMDGILLARISVVGLPDGGLNDGGTSAQDAGPGPGSDGRSGCGCQASREGAAAGAPGRDNPAPLGFGLILLLGLGWRWRASRVRLGNLKEQKIVFYT